MDPILILVGALLFVKKPDGTQVAAGDIRDTLNWTMYDSAFRTSASRYNIEWQWAKAVAINESLLGLEKSVKRGIQDPTDVEGSKSFDGKSWGIMQVTLNTAQKDLDPSATVIKMNNPFYSIDLGCQYIGLMKKRYYPTTEYIIKAYNQGPGNTDKEKRREIVGFAGEYWKRFLRNLELVKS